MITISGPSVGKARAAQLLVKFGSARRVAALEPKELQAVPGIGPALAEKIISHLGKLPPGANGP
jgi:excinuclease ABC subunit C